MDQRTQTSKTLSRSKAQYQQRGSDDIALLHQAYTLHRQGDLDEAQKVYEALLVKVPTHAEAMGNLGLLLHSQGEVERAVASYQQAVALSPQQQSLYYFLGNGLRELGSPLEAIPAYEKALACGYDRCAALLALGAAHVDAEQFAEAQQCFATILEHDAHHVEAAYHQGLLFFLQEEFSRAAASFRSVLAVQSDHIDACFNQALCYKAMGETTQALDSLRRAERLDPGDADILYNIGVLYKERGDFSQAETFFLKALSFQPNNGICLTDLAILYHIQNRLEEAEGMYQRAVAGGYHTDSAVHMLSALQGTTTGSTPLQHVRDLFNNYAGAFDESLVQGLSYSVPSQLAELLVELDEGFRADTALDLGCGTGLSGLALSNMVTHFTGIDLAENMLALAREKQLYDELHCLDIIGFLQTCTTRYDLVLAADVFVYLGELETFFLLVEKVLSPGGVLLFSVETSGQDYTLRQSGRYAHSPAYIGGLAARFGFTLLQQKSAGIRKERGAWIPGELYILKYG